MTAGGAKRRVAGLVLAAGTSRRMGAGTKLLAEIGGRPVVAHAVAAAAASAADPVLVVVGHQGEAVRAAVAGIPVTFVHNPGFAGGLSTSLGAGLDALGGDVDGVVVCLGDMPRVTPGVIDRLIAAFDPGRRRAICVPTWRGKRGNPVLFARRFFPEMGRVSGDMGARGLIGTHADQVCEVTCQDDGVLFDVDTPEGLRTAANAVGPS